MVAAISMSAAEKSKMESYFLTAFKFIFNQLPKHYMYLPGLPVMYKTISLFERAVDERQVPGYSQVIKEPMDLSLMKKRVDSHKAKYMTSTDASAFLFAILQDLDLIRNNCYTFNPNEVDAGVRMMVDGTRNYFRYLLKIVLQIITSFMPDKFHTYVLGSMTELHDLILEPVPDDVAIFLSYRTVDIKQAIVQEDLLKVLLGSKVATQKDTLATLDKLCQFPVVDDPNKPVDAAAAAGTGAAGGGSKKASSKSKASTTAVDTTAASSSGTVKLTGKSTSTVALKRSKSDAKQSSVGLASNNDYEDDFIDLESPQPKAKASKGNVYEVQGYDDEEEDDNYDEDEYYEDEDDSVNGGKKRGKGKAGKRKSQSVGGSRPAKRSKSTASTEYYGDDIDQPVGEEYYVAPQDYYGSSADAAASNTAWWSAAEAVLKLIYKHTYVDFSTKTTLVAADFFNPVIHPDYQREIPEPMDLTTLQYLMLNNQLSGPLEFSLKLISIFQNAIDFNSNPIRNTSSITRQIIAKCQHLVKFAKWVCLEKLPLDDDNEELEAGAPITTAAASSSSDTFQLTKQKQLEARQEREQIIFSMAFQEMIDSELLNRRSSHNSSTSLAYKECKSIFQEITRTKNKQEQEELSIFIVPINTNQITDYAVYVRRKMDLSTLMYKLDRTLPTNREIANLLDQSESQYEYYSEFFKDLRLIFSNAIKYNEAHVETDTTQVSLWITTVAKQFQQRLETQIIPKHSLTLADRIAITKYVSTMYQEEALRKQEEDAKEAILLREKERQLIETYKMHDPIFAADLDREAKLRNTEKLLKEEAEAKKRAIVNSGAVLGSTSPLDDASISSPMHSPEHGGPSGGVGGPGASNVPKGPLMVGYGLRGAIPSRIKKDLIELKERVSKSAWNICSNFTATAPKASNASADHHHGNQSKKSHPSGNHPHHLPPVFNESKSEQPPAAHQEGDKKTDIAPAVEETVMKFTPNLQWKSKLVKKNTLFNDDDEDAMETC